MRKPRRIRPSAALMALPPLVTTTEVSRLIGVTATSLARHCRAGRFPGARLFGGRDWAIPKAALLAYYGVTQGSRDN